MNQDSLKEVINYDPDTGLITWLCSRQKVRAGEEAGGVDARGYRRVCIDGVSYKAHHIAFLFMEGIIPNEVDHINRVRSDNRWSNLRACTRRENTQNKTTYKNNRSGIPGVCWNSVLGRWQARIGSSPRIHLGRFDDFFEACCVRKAAELKLQYNQM